MTRYSLQTRVMNMMKNDFQQYSTLTDRKNRHAGSAPRAVNDSLKFRGIYLS